MDGFSEDVEQFAAAESSLIGDALDAAAHRILTTAKAHVESSGAKAIHLNGARAKRRSGDSTEGILETARGIGSGRCSLAFDKQRGEPHRSLRARGLIHELPHLPCIFVYSADRPPGRVILEEDIIQPEESIRCTLAANTATINFWNNFSQWNSRVIRGWPPTLMTISAGTDSFAQSVHCAADCVRDVARSYSG